MTANPAGAQTLPTTEAEETIDPPQETTQDTPTDTPHDTGDTSPDENRDTPPLSGELTHREAMRIVHEGLAEALAGDPLLGDLPAEVTVEEVNLQIALEYGQAMTVRVKKFPREIMPVVVLQGARVQDLKQAIQRHVTLKESRKGSQVSISWKYVWRTYSLCFDGEELDKNKKLKEYGIRNRDKVKFVKRRQKAGDKY